VTLSAARVGAPLDMAGIGRAVDVCLMSFLDGKVRASEADGTTNDMVHVLRDFLSSGGKRLRPTLCAIGWYAVAGSTGLPPTAVVQVAASLEMFHAFALIHDDVMDHSDIRRGRPSAHRAFASMHRAAHRGDCTASDDIGESCAVLLGDLALVWSSELLHTAGLQPARLGAVLPLVRRYADRDHVRAVPGSARYRASRRGRGGRACHDPLQDCQVHVRASVAYRCWLAGGGEVVRDALTRYAIPLGEAFQLRDDVLGVFGDPQRTGKSALDDLA